MIEIKAVYTVPELGRMMGMERHRVARMIRRLGIPVQPGRPGLVWLLRHQEPRSDDLGLARGGGAPPASWRGPETPSPR